MCRALLSGLLAVVLLLPVPAWALTFSAWTLTNPGGNAPNWWLTSSGSTTAAAGPSFDILPAASSGIPGGVTYTIVGQVTAQAGDSSINATLKNFDALTNISGPGNQKLVVNVAVVGAGNPINNQQFSGNPPATVAGTAKTVTPGSVYDIKITFNFESNVSWGVNSSPTRIQVNFGS